MTDQEEITRHWRISDSAVLVETKFGECTTYFVANEKIGEVAVALGSASDGTVKTITGEAVEFICRGLADDGILSFPYLARYSLADGSRSTAQAHLTVETPLDLGTRSIEGLPELPLELIGVKVTENSLRLDMTSYVNNLPVIRVRPNAEKRALLIELIGIRTPSVGLPVVYKPHGAIIDRVTLSAVSADKPGFSVEIAVGAADWSKLTYSGTEGWGEHIFVEFDLSDEDKPTDLTVSVPEPDK